MFDLHDPGSVERARRAFRAFLETGEVHNAALVLRRDDGTRIDVSLNASAVRDEEGRIVRARLVWHDITHLKLAERRLRESLVRQKDLLQRERTLRRELNHRVRNNLASILGLVRVYERAGKDARTFSEAVRGKVRAMSEVHDMISGAHGLLVDLATLTDRLAAFAAPPQEDGAEERGRRVCFSGPAAAIPASQAAALAMIVQELLTNARKHGALSTPEGVISVDWSLESSGDADILELTWAESGGPPVSPPGPRGVGLGLITGLTEAELQGRCEFLFEPHGLRFVLSASLDPSARAPAPSPLMVEPSNRSAT